MSNKKISNLQLITDLAFAINYDLAVIKISSNQKTINAVSICSAILNPKFISCSYVKASNLNEPFFIPRIEFNEKLNGNRSKVSIPFGFLHHFKMDAHGADALGGISGSPVILHSQNNPPIFHGVITRIPNNGVGNIVEIRSLEPLQDVIQDLQMRSHTELDDDHSLIRYHAALLENDRFDQWVEGWKNEPGNKNYYSNLKSKLKVIFGDQYINEMPKELQRIMIGDSYIKQIIEKNSVLYGHYQDIVQTAEREHMVAYVNDAKEAYEHYQKIYNEHLQVVMSDLDDFDLRRTDHKKIAQHDVSTWLAVCNLRFCEK